MSVMGSIVCRVFDEGSVGVSAARGGFAVAPARRVTGPLTFPEPVDVDAILARIATRRREVLHWRSSIVDLLKLLNLDSSYDVRCDLARELGYCGNIGDSASMNSWLHKEVMQRLAESDPKVLNSYLN